MPESDSYSFKGNEENIAVAAGIVALLLLVWLIKSWSYYTRGFDAAIIPKYPSAMQQEQMNSATTFSYSMYPRIPTGTMLTNW